MHATNSLTEQHWESLFKCNLRRLRVLSPFSEKQTKKTKGALVKFLRVSVARLMEKKICGVQGRTPCQLEVESYALGKRIITG